MSKGLSLSLLLIDIVLPPFPMTHFKKRALKTFTSHLLTLADSSLTTRSVMTGWGRDEGYRGKRYMPHQVPHPAFVTPCLVVAIQSCME